jgi:parvulin-like peptidyl-prolyl isomerase
MRKSYVILVVACVAILATALTVGCSKNKSGQVEEDQAKTTETAQVVQPAPPGTVRASHILVAYQGSGVAGVTRTKEEAYKLAQDLLAKVRAGESFEELAANYSDCPSAEQGGDLGFFPRGRMVRPFEEAAFGLKPGGVSGIVETQFGYHIIKRTQ